MTIARTPKPKCAAPDSSATCQAHDGARTGGDPETTRASHGDVREQRGVTNCSSLGRFLERSGMLTRWHEPNRSASGCGARLGLGEFAGEFRFDCLATGRPLPALTVRRTQFIPNSITEARRMTVNFAKLRSCYARIGVGSCAKNG
jgi:hypothetical protein